MPTITQHAPGTFCWPELMTTDGPAAKKFYSELFGWESSDVPMGEEGPYTLLRLRGQDAGALMNMPKEVKAMGAPPHWGAYVAVASADETVAKAKSLGGTVYKE